MKFFRSLFACGFTVALPAWAVYAPVPDQAQGKALTFTAKVGLSYDDNLFGAAKNEVGSAVWQFAPRVAYNASVADQTFLSAAYGLNLERFDRRPGNKTLDSHELSARVAHAFTKTTTLDVNELFAISRNPESLLNGLPLNTDQSLQRNQLDGRFTTTLAPKIGLTAKARGVYFDYRNAALNRSLGRTETLLGVSADYAILPELKGVGEYRHLDVSYRTLGQVKDKSSDFLMAGADYNVARQLTMSGRLGGESRRRKGERDTTVPYAEFSAKYDYAEASFLTGGYVYTLEETSDPLRFTDTKVNRFFVNVQHRVTALIVASGSLTYEPSQLQGRRGQRNVAEDTTRAGVGLNYLPDKNWTISANYDIDRVTSSLPGRALRRGRVGASASYAF